MTASGRPVGRSSRPSIAGCHTAVIPSTCVGHRTTPVSFIPNVDNSLWMTGVPAGQPDRRPSGTGTFLEPGRCSWGPPRWMASLSIAVMLGSLDLALSGAGRRGPAGRRRLRRRRRADDTRPGPDPGPAGRRARAGWWCAGCSGPDRSAGRRSAQSGCRCAGVSGSRTRPSRSTWPTNPCTSSAASTWEPSRSRSARTGPPTRRAAPGLTGPGVRPAGVIRRVDSSARRGRRYMTIGRSVRRGGSAARRARPTRRCRRPTCQAVRVFGGG